MARHDKKLYSTGDAAREVGCSPDSLRYYEKRGKIAPTQISNGERIYTQRDIDTARGLFGHAKSSRRTRPLTLRTNQRSR